MPHVWVPFLQLIHRILNFPTYSSPVHVDAARPCHLCQRRHFLANISVPPNPFPRPCLLLLFLRFVLAAPFRRSRVAATLPSHAPSLSLIPRQLLARGNVAYPTPMPRCSGRSRNPRIPRARCANVTNSRRRHSWSSSRSQNSPGLSAPR
jgi:hypothetical protein